MCYCYVLYSQKLDKFYIGATNSNLIERIERHNQYSYGTHRFTAISDDWELFIQIQTIDYAHAIRLEQKIKAMKSKLYIYNLKKYPEMINKIFKETS